MMSMVVFFFTLLASVFGQTNLQIQAAGSLPDGSSSATAQGVGQGANVVGEANVQVTNTQSSSSLVLTATGPAGPAPRPRRTPTPQPAPKTTVVVQTIAVPVCKDLKDKQCPKIDNFHNCGFCITKNYPIKGFACEFQRQIVVKNAKLIVPETEVVISPLCKCKGKFIIQGDVCPSCDKLLAALLKCAGIKKTSGTIEIPEKCLKQVGVTQQNVKDCGFLSAPVVNVKPIVVADKKKDVIAVPTTVVVPATTTVVVPAPVAQASAVASGVNANAVATATAGN